MLFGKLSLVSQQDLLTRSNTKPLSVKPQHVALTRSVPTQPRPAWERNASVSPSSSDLQKENSRNRWVWSFSAPLNFSVQELFQERTITQSLEINISCAHKHENVLRWVKKRLNGKCSSRDCYKRSTGCQRALQSSLSPQTSEYHNLFL